MRGAIDVVATQRVFLVDDDEAVRLAMSRLFESAGIDHRLYPSGDGFLEDYSPELCGCLVLDMRMPGADGMAVQRRLNTLGSALPIIFMTGHGELPIAVRAMRLGALHFLRKPVDDTELLDTIKQAFERESDARRESERRQDAAHRLATLTDREIEIFERVGDGEANKRIAGDLEISQRTVETHRAKVMRKLGVRTLAELIRLRIDVQRLP